jgi:hypothetical protein
VYVGREDGRILRYTGTSGELDDFTLQGEPLEAVLSMAVAPNGGLYVLGRRQNSYPILRYQGEDGVLLGVVIADLATPYPPPETPRLSAGQLEVGPDNTLYLLDTQAHILTRFHPTTGAFLGTVVGPDERIFYGSAFTFGPNGAIYISEGLRATLDNTPRRIFHYSATGQFRDVLADVPWPGDLRFGPDGDLYVTSNDSLVRLNGQTGALLGTVIASRLDPSVSTQLSPQRFTFAGHAAAPTVKPAMVTVTQRASPALQVRPGAIVTMTIVAKNHGQGSAKETLITLPFNSAQVEVRDASFSRTTAWVRALREDALEIQTGPLGAGSDAITATLRLRVRDDASVGAVLGARPSYRWRDAAGGGAGAGNLLPLVVADEERDASTWPLAVTPLSARPGTDRQAWSTVW